MNKYKHGDEVQVKPSTESGDFKPASVVGITVVETEEAAKHFDSPIGSVFYTVEFADGSDAFVPESNIKK